MDYKQEIYKIVENIQQEQVLRLLYAFIKHLTCNPELSSFLVETEKQPKDG